MKPGIILLLTLMSFNTWAATYAVGPSQAYANIGDVPWESMSAGDTVLIYHRANPYFEKWNINVQGTAQDPFVVIGVLGSQGERPIISGENAVTRTQLNYWSDERGVIKIGGSSIPADNLPSYIIIENLEIKSGHSDYTYTDDNGSLKSYLDNASCIYLEKATTSPLEIVSYMILVMAYLVRTKPQIFSWKKITFMATAMSVDS